MLKLFGGRKMDRSQLPLVRKKKTSKEVVVSREKDVQSTKKDKTKAFQGRSGAVVASTGCQATSSPRDDGSPGRVLLPSSPGYRKDLGSRPRRVDRLPVNGNGVDLMVGEEDARTPRTPVDWEWSKYVVRGGQPSCATYQRFVPPAEKSAADQDIQGKARQHQDVSRRPVTGLITPKLQYSQLPHLTGQQQQYYSGGKQLNSPVDYPSPTSAVGYESRSHAGGVNGKSSHPQVFTFDQKAFDDMHDSSPIYHELDPLGLYDPSAHHTYQSITELKEEVNRLQAEAARGCLGGPPAATAIQPTNLGPPTPQPVPSQTAVSGPAATIKSDSGTARSPVTDCSPKRRSSKTLPSHLARVCGAPRSPTLLPGPGSPTVPGQQGPTRAQSIFSKLWQQKKPAQVPKDIALATAKNGDYSSARNLSLGDVRGLDSPNSNRNFSSLHAIASPPPTAAAAMTDYYRRLAGNHGPPSSPSSPTSPYGMAACRNLLNFNGSSAKRSFSDSTSVSNSLSERGKGGGKSGVAYENRLPWRNGRELSPLNNGKSSSADRWDIARFGEPVDSHVPGGSNVVSLETFKSKKSSPKPSKACSSSPCYQCPGKSQSSSAKKESVPAVKKGSKATKKGSTETTDGRAREIDRFPDQRRPVLPLSRTMTGMSCMLSKSQENVLSAFPLDLFTTSPPGSFESLLSEDDVFLPSSNERLNLLSPPLPRTTFSSPSCGVRMAELRAGRRKSDSKSPSPEPPVSTPPPPPHLPFFQISSVAAYRLEAVSKQDVAVQTSPVRSPVRFGGKNSHRYMHTIIEEDHQDQGHSSSNTLNTAGCVKQPSICAESAKAKTTAPDTSRKPTNLSVHGHSALSLLHRRETDEFGKEEVEEVEDATSGNLLEIISEADADDDDDDDNSSSPGRRGSSAGKIRLSDISSSFSAGNLPAGGATEGATTDNDNGSSNTMAKSPSPQSVQHRANEVPSSSVFPNVERLSQMSCVPSTTDCCLSTGSGATSADGDTVSLPTVRESPVERLASSSRPVTESIVRLKGSKLRPPKPAKCIAVAVRVIDGQQQGTSAASNHVTQQRDNASELPRYSAQFVKSRVGETARPLVRQFNDTAVETTPSPLVKEAAVRSIESIGVIDHNSKSIDTRSSAQPITPEPPRGDGPTVPLRGVRGASQEKSPVAQRSRIPGEQRKNIASSKSQPSIASTSSSSATSGCRSQTDGALSETNPDGSSSGGSQSLPSKADSGLANRNSSLSSSLTSSSSSSLYSVADSESENSVRTRRDSLISVTRSIDLRSSPSADSADRTTTTPGKTGGKPGLSDGKGLEKSRLAIPKVSVARCKERIEKAPKLTNDNNFCDDDKNKCYPSPASSTDL